NTNRFGSESRAGRRRRPRTAVNAADVESRNHHPKITLCRVFDGALSLHLGCLWGCRGRRRIFCQSLSRGAAAAWLAGGHRLRQACSNAHAPTLARKAGPSMTHPALTVRLRSVCGRTCICVQRTCHPCRLEDLMQLYVTYTSPYARLARLLVVEKALAD